MSERIPTAEDIRLALTTVGYTEDEAAEGIDRIKQRGIGIGHEMAREAMQASIGDAVRKLQAEAWDEGFRTSERCWEELWDLTTPDEARTSPTNPYRKGESNE